MIKIFKNKRGFTLIEALTICLLISILAVMILPHFRRALEKARLTDCMNSERVFGTMIQTYYLEYKDFPTPDPNGTVPFTKLTPYYTKADQKTYCPASDLQYRYEVDQTIDNFTIFCELPGGASHSKLGIPALYPKYTFTTGVLTEPLY